MANNARYVQSRRTTILKREEFIVARKDSDLSIAEAAAECGISANYAYKLHWFGEYKIGARRRICRKDFDHRRATGQEVATIKQKQ